MKWDQGHQSPDVIDRRGQGGGGPGLGGMLGLLPLLTRVRGGWIIALILVGLTLAGGLGGIFGRSTSDESTQAPVAGRKTDDKKAQFVAFVLDDTQNTWKQEFTKHNKSYRNAKLVMFTNATNTACGSGQAASGPFYCPLDERVYIDLSFYNQLEQRLGAKGDFAQAYVIAHEIGHHVQHQLGISDKVHEAKRSQQRGEEGLSVRLELQADCFAGMWAHSSGQRDLLEAGDIDEALGAAAAIGDDRLQKQSGRTVNPETWTHGSSAQRSHWFKKGYERGDMDACDTFNGNAI
jgi:uncharacterized protein